MFTFVMLKAQLPKSALKLQQLGQTFNRRTVNTRLEQPHSSWGFAKNQTV
ncbi:hypothetical protein QWZ13_02830 [Reinekea marina]|nr:hypothetical protein [Reinekea marina]MDN3647845.1 hypothetical protein [Reinekea marina]